mmetsp:Transcript_34989/g.54541  ORF Transcript_34989/g.54541 Transcript_34989/m.54541 type:complete len:270 (-) Transcript_34989:41-850(-)
MSASFDTIDSSLLRFGGKLRLPESTPLNNGAYSPTEVVILTGLVTCLFQFITTIIFHTQKHRSSPKDVNTMGSLVHAVTSSVLIFTTLAFSWNEFKFTEEYLIYSQLGSFVRIWSSGYFVSDFISMIQDGLLKKEMGLTLHHVATISTLFGASVLSLYAPIHLLFLLAEVNSVFLHIRALMHGFKIDKTSVAYRVNMVGFWASLWTCRLAISCLMFYILYEFGGAFPEPWQFNLALFGTVVISFVNVYLLWELGLKKVIFKRDSKEKEN